MADIFDDPFNNMTPIADTATDADAPNTALLMDKIRIWLEQLICDVNGKFGTGTLTSDPPNDTTGYAYDTAAGFTDDEHNNQRIIFTDGNALGQDFLIDDTIAASNAVICTGDNLYAAGARSGDAYIIVGNFRTAQGHIHNGLSARNYIPYLSKIGGIPKNAHEYSETGGSVTPVEVSRMQIYMPVDAQYIYMYSWVKVAPSSTYYAYASFTVNSNTSSYGGTNQTTYTQVVSSLDVSAISAGWYNLILNLHESNINADAYMDGFDLFIV